MHLVVGPLVSGRWLVGRLEGGLSQGVGWSAVLKEPTVSLKTCAARFTLVTENDVRFIWSLVSLLTNFKPHFKSS